MMRRVSPSCVAALSLSLLCASLLGSGCIPRSQTPPVISSKRAQAHSASQDLSSLSIEQPVVLTRGSLLDCEPPQASAHHIPFTLVLNPHQVHLSSYATQRLQRWSSWLQAHRVEFAIERYRAQTTRGQLREERHALDHLLTQRGWSLGKSPLRAWYVPHGQEGDPNVHTESLKPEAPDSLGGWVAIHRITPQSHVHVLGTRLSAEPPSSLRRCDALLSALRLTSYPHAEPQRLSVVAAPRLDPGLRLLKAPRPPISATCARLFDLNQEVVTTDRAELDQIAPRWHILLRYIPRSLSKRETGHDQGEKLTQGAAQYLTLPLPTDPHLLPVDWSEQTLGHLWEKRELWWGAQGCWHTVEPEQVLAPLSGITTRWVDVHAQPHSTSVFSVKRWRHPHATISQPTARVGLEWETNHQVDVEIRGVVSALNESQRAIDIQASAPRLTALWSRGAPRAFLLGGIVSLPIYEALAQLSGDRVIRRLALSSLSSIGPLIYLPRDGRTPPPDWTRSLQQLVHATKHSPVNLRDGDLITLEATATNARYLLGSPSSFPTSRRGVLKERLSRFIRAHGRTPPHIRPGHTLTFTGGPWLGTQSHRVTAPLTQLP